MANFQVTKLRSLWKKREWECKRSMDFEWDGRENKNDANDDDGGRKQ